VLLIVLLKQGLALIGVRAVLAQRQLAGGKKSDVLIGALHVNYSYGQSRPYSPLLLPALRSPIEPPGDRS
jgi:hypothetical protein